MRTSRAMSAPSREQELKIFERGRVQLHILRGRPSRRYYLYLPGLCSRNNSESPALSNLLVTCHGISRNARTHVVAFQNFAERFNTAVLAPLFDDNFYPDYQRLGRKNLGHRSDLALNDMLEDVEEHLGFSEKILMFGFSGGGQFVHRYAMAYPEKLKAYALAAAGWYTFPDRRKKFPHGLRSTSRLPGLMFSSASFLKIPACVFVGRKDHRRDDQLRKTPRIDRQQGRHRITRGFRWVREMNRAAQEHDLKPVFEFQLLPRSAHDFEECLARDDLDKRVESFFQHAGVLANA